MPRNDCNLKPRGAGDFHIVGGVARVGAVGGEDRGVSESPAASGRGRGPRGPAYR